MSAKDGKEKAALKELEKFEESRLKSENSARKRQKRPPVVRVLPAEQAARLVRKVDPLYTVGNYRLNHPILTAYFVLTIGVDGAVREALFTGNVDESPRTLNQSGSVVKIKEALLKWRYTPLVVKGKPVEVWTGVEVPFGPGRGASVSLAELEEGVVSDQEIRERLRREAELRAAPKREAEVAVWKLLTGQTRISLTSMFEGIAAGTFRGPVSPYVFVGYVGEMGNYCLEELPSNYVVVEWKTTITTTGLFGTRTTDDVPFSARSTIVDRRFEEKFRQYLKSVNPDHYFGTDGVLQIQEWVRFKGCGEDTKRFGVNLLRLAYGRPPVQVEPEPPSTVPTIGFVIRNSPSGPALAHKLGITVR